MEKLMNVPFNKEDAKSLTAGDRVSLTGIIYAARDAAHQKMIELLEEGKELPFDVAGQVIYYVGPCPAKPGEIIGSAGPTTSGRMDKYTPRLLEMGLSGMIGKGKRCKDVVEAIVAYDAVYFAAIGGVGALLAERIVKEEIIAFPELGSEAVRKLEVVDFPVFVIVDTKGRDLYEEGRNRFKK